MGKADYALMAEYHRGYEDGKAARAADEWALQQKRIQVMNKVTEHLQSKLTSYKKLGYSIDNEAMMVNCLGFERSMSPFLHHVISEIVGKDEYSVTDVVNGLSELLGVDPNNDCPFVGYDMLDNERHDDMLSETIRNSDVYYARPSATHKPWVAKEQRDKISPPKCMDGKVIHLGDFVVTDDCNGHEVMGEVWEIKRCLVLNCWSINISTPAAFAIPSECRWFLETQVMRHATREEKAPIVSRLVQDGIVSDKWAEKQLKDESSQYAEVLYDEIGFAQNPAAQVVYDDLLDLLRDAAVDYRSLQQADELRTHVLDAAIEENKSLRRKLREPDTPESIVRDLTLGNISESDAIRRIEKLWEDA